MNARLIPCLSLDGRRLVKTVRFRSPTYVGDPLNTVRIFNEKEVDELILLDITATRQGRPPDFDVVAELADECFMPLGYGGGVRSLHDIERLFAVGVEKVALNSAAFADANLVAAAAERFGSQSIVVSVDAGRLPGGGYEVFTRGGTSGTGMEPAPYARRMQERGAGEILLNAIDLDGTMQGYDLKLVRMVAEAVSIPVVACGGAGRLEDFGAVVRAGASAAAAGSFFVFQGKHRAVLLTYPSRQERQQLQAHPAA